MAQTNAEANFKFSDDTRSDVYFFSSRNNSCRPHFHQCVELVYALSGTLCATLDGREYTVEAGRMLIVDSYTIHMYRTPEASDTLIMVVPFSFLPQLKGRLTGRQFNQALITPSPDARGLFLFLAQNWSLWGPQAHGSAAQTLLEILVEQVGLRDEKRRPDDDLIHKMLMFIIDQHTTDITLDDVAEHVGYSKSRVSHLFSMYFGCSFVALVNEWRCHTAMALLRNTDMKVVEVAYASGFNSVRTFNRAFLLCYGVAPRDHLKLIPRKAAPEKSVAAPGWNTGR